MEQQDDKKEVEVPTTPTTDGSTTPTTDGKRSKKEKKATAAGEDGAEKKDSKAEREKAKADRLAARQVKSTAAKEYVKDESDPCAN